MAFTGADGLTGLMDFAGLSVDSVWSTFVSLVQEEVDLWIPWNANFPDVNPYKLTFDDMLECGRQNALQKKALQAGQDEAGINSAFDNIYTFFNDDYVRTIEMVNKVVLLVPPLLDCSSHVFNTIRDDRTSSCKKLSESIEALGDIEATRYAVECANEIRSKDPSCEELVGGIAAFVRVEGPLMKLLQDLETNQGLDLGVDRIRAIFYSFEKEIEAYHADDDQYAEDKSISSLRQTARVTLGLDESNSSLAGRPFVHSMIIMALLASAVAAMATS